MHDGTVVDLLSRAGLSHSLQYPHMLVVAQLDHLGNKIRLRLYRHLLGFGHVLCDLLLLLPHLVQMPFDRITVFRLGLARGNDFVEIRHDVCGHAECSLLSLDRFVQLCKRIGIGIAFGNRHLFERFDLEHKRFRSAHISGGAEILAECLQDITSAGLEQTRIDRQQQSLERLGLAGRISVIPRFERRLGAARSGRFVLHIDLSGAEIVVGLNVKAEPVAEIDSLSQFRCDELDLGPPVLLRKYWPFGDFDSPLEAGRFDFYLVRLGRLQLRPDDPEFVFLLERHPVARILVPEFVGGLVEFHLHDNLRAGGSRQGFGRAEHAHSPSARVRRRGNVKLRFLDSRDFVDCHLYALAVRVACEYAEGK